MYGYDLTSPAPPYEFDAYLVWSLYRGVGDRFRDEDFQRFVLSLEPLPARLEFTEGLLAGAYRGAHAELQEEFTETVRLIEAGMNWVLEGYSLSYDIYIWRRLVRFLDAAPNSAEQVQEMEKLRGDLRVHHPAVRELLDTLVVLLPQLEAFAKWLQQPDAMRKVLGAIVHDLGELVGDAWARVASHPGKPRAQGEALGDTIGRFTMDVALYVVGF